MTLLDRDSVVVPEVRSGRTGVWFTFALVSLLALAVLDLRVWTVAVLVVGAGLATVPRLRPPSRSEVDLEDLVVLGVVYVGVVGLFRLAFTVFTTTDVLGLGVVYAVAYRLTENVLMVWPLLTPVGAFFTNLDSRDIDLPWASLMGFADVAVVMAAAIWLARRRIRRLARTSTVAPGAVDRRRSRGCRGRGGRRLRPGSSGTTRTGPGGAPARYVS